MLTKLDKASRGDPKNSAAKFSLFVFLLACVCDFLGNAFARKLVRSAGISSSLRKTLFLTGVATATGPGLILCGYALLQIMQFNDYQIGTAYLLMLASVVHCLAPRRG